MGGGMSIDGVTMKTQDKHFYDLTVHYFDFGPSVPFSSGEPLLACRTLLLAESTEGDSAFQIRQLLSYHLNDRYQIKFSAMMEKFTLVSDWAAVMPNIVGASVSENISNLNEKWMGCIVHQLNTVMKTCLQSCEADPALIRVAEDLAAVKTLVRIFKQGKWNHELGDGFHLIQEIETRFATTHAVADRFLSVGLSAFAIVGKHNSGPAKKAKNSILKRKDPHTHHYGFPAIEAVVDACDIIVHMQKKLETSHSPTMHLVLPFLRKCKIALQRIEEGVNVDRGFSRGMVPPSEYSIRLCQSMRKVLGQKIRVHDLWIVGCMLHPFLRELQFVDMPEREEYQQRGASFIRKLLQSMTHENGNSEGDTTTSQRHADQRSETGAVLGANFIRSCGAENHAQSEQLTGKSLKRNFDTLDFADSHFDYAADVSGDEVTKYLTRDIPRFGLEKAKFLKDDFAAIKFWKDK